VLEKSEINFKFAEDNHKMYTTEKLRVFNKGNAPATYDF
jgi:hypothetical protein